MFGLAKYFKDLWKYRFLCSYQGAITLGALASTTLIFVHSLVIGEEWWLDWSLGSVVVVASYGILIVGGNLYTIFQRVYEVARAKDESTSDFIKTIKRRTFNLILLLLLIVAVGIMASLVFFQCWLGGIKLTPYFPMVIALVLTIADFFFAQYLYHLLKDQQIDQDIRNVVQLDFEELKIVIRYVDIPSVVSLGVLTIFYVLGVNEVWTSTAKDVSVFDIFFSGANAASLITCNTLFMYIISKNFIRNNEV